MLLRIARNVNWNESRLTRLWKNGMSNGGGLALASTA